MMPRSLYTLALACTLAASIFLTGCDVTRQARQASNLAECDFRIRSVERVNLAGVDMQHVKSVSDLGITDVARVLAGFASPTMPLTLQLNVEGRNPNSDAAGLNRLEWILFIDDIQMTSGILQKAFVIPAKGTAIIPVDMALDLKEILTGKSAEAALNFCVNLAGLGGTPTRFKIKLKPTIVVAGRPVTYPGYITVNTTYSSGDR